VSLLIAKWDKSIRLHKAKFTTNDALIILSFYDLLQPLQVKSSFKP